MLIFCVVWIGLALTRFNAHQANAVDLGYIAQIFHNTAHGDPFRLTIYDPSTGPDRYNNYFFYHAEPIMFVLAPFYGLFNRPEVLLIFQVLALASGAVPAYWLARKRLESRWAGLVFATMYLLAPSLQAAALSDYHNVALAAPLFMYALYFGWKRQGRLFVLFALLAVSTKEDVTLLGLMLGLYAFFVWRLRWSGVVVTLTSLAWFLAVTRLIIPYFSGTSDAATLFYRYPAYGKNAVEIATTLLTRPIYVWNTLPRSEIFAYLTGLWQQSGGLAILNPLMGLVISPVLLINSLSNNSWQHSGGAHYSVALVPFLIGGGITGFGWLLERHLLQTPHFKFLTPLRIKNIGLTLALLVALFYYVRASVGPLTLHTYAPQLTTAQIRHQHLLDQFITEIPATASVSAQNNLVVFVSQRRTVFLYPRLLNNEEFARYVLLDVTADTFPQQPKAYVQSVQQLLASPDYGVIDARDGYLLFERGRLPTPSTPILPAAFYTFTDTNPAEINFNNLRQDIKVQTANNTEFANGKLKFLGTQVVAQYQIGYFNPPLEITSYWQVLSPPLSDLQVVYEFGNGKGGKDEVYCFTSSNLLWKPANSWQTGQIITLHDYPVIAGRFNNMSVTISSDKSQ